MSYSPAMVTMFIPLMKELNLSWAEIKATPRVELMGLAQALSEYNVLHSFDGYDAKDIDSMAKDKPKVRGKYNEYLQKRRQYGVERGAKSLFEAVQ
tara:strand:- start:1073 stop:1360 length:288 start_codon:yes stop_codon:yes gene_type:complete